MEVEQDALFDLSNNCSPASHIEMYKMASSVSGTFIAQPTSDDDNRDALGDLDELVSILRKQDCHLCVDMSYCSS